MIKKIRLGTRINEAVEQVQTVLNPDLTTTNNSNTNEDGAIQRSITLVASGAAISKAITIAEIVKRRGLGNNKQSCDIIQNTRLVSQEPSHSSAAIQTKTSKMDLDNGNEEQDKEVVVEEEGQWKEVLGDRQRQPQIVPVLEITLTCTASSSISISDSSNQEQVLGCKSLMQIPK